MHDRKEEDVLESHTIVQDTKHKSAIMLLHELNLRLVHTSGPKCSRTITPTSGNQYPTGADKSYFLAQPHAPSYASSPTYLQHVFSAAHLHGPGIPSQGAVWGVVVLVIHAPVPK